MIRGVVRLAIVLFGVLSLGFVSLFFIIGDPDDYETLGALYARLDATPSIENLRRLLDYPADGAYAYYKMALTGAALTEHAECFRMVYEDLQTERERRSVETLVTLGAGVFEYHPELKPLDFESRLRALDWFPGSSR